jgi:glycerophosphoryl diester phosphodiesterase
MKEITQQPAHPVIQQPAHPIQYQPQQAIKLLGHRGSPLVARENSLESFEQARLAGLDGIEFDVQRSADGLLVVHHDEHLRDGRLIAALRQTELASAGVALLEEVLVWAKDQAMFLNIELKQSRASKGCESQCAKLIRRVGLANQQVLVSSFDPRMLWRLRLADQHLPSALLFTKNIAFDVWSPYLALVLGVQAIHPHYTLVNADLLRFAHDQQWQVNAWTVNEPDVASRLLALGVDGLIGDKPEMLLQQRQLLSDQNKTTPKR